MQDDITPIQTLRDLVSEKETELIALRKQLATLEAQYQRRNDDKTANITDSIRPGKPWPWPLAAEEYTRYGRQMILPGFGLPGQLHLRNASVLIIGLGGLGCPAAAYLAGAGVGTLGLVDGDDVEVSNLHRQILHSSTGLGLKKVDSAAMALNSINPLLTYKTYPSHLEPATAIELFQSYDLILDCTDTPQTRYLISDAAVLCGKPLISASALRTDGQLVVLNHPPAPAFKDRREEITSGPCYRCVFPRPPPPESVTSCGEGGILGPVVGVMGVLMALEALKLLSSGSILSDKSTGGSSEPSGALPIAKHSLMILSAAGSDPVSFRTIRLKGKRADCIACGSNASITVEDMMNGSINYAVFCGVANSLPVLNGEEQIDAQSLSELVNSSNETDVNKTIIAPIILDVRDEAQFSICSLPGSLNIPWNSILRYNLAAGKSSDQDPLETLRSRVQQSLSSSIYTICRLGNDSQLAVKKLQGLEVGGKPQQFLDVKGGFRSWKRDVDKNWPEY